jgi:peptidylprolyl isomerase
MLRQISFHFLLALLVFSLAACRDEASTPGSMPESGASSDEATSGQKEAGDQSNIVYLDLKSGRVTIKLRPDLAPQHVKRIKALVARDFYDGIVFHRVIDGFMAQTGDPTGTGMGGSDLPDLQAEFTGEPFERGTIGMARANDPNSANSQFFIMFDDGDFLNGKYTVIGEVIDGMQYVDAIKRGDGPNGLVNNPDKIIRMELADDAGSSS